MALDPDSLSPDALLGKLINAGLRLARTEGLGLPLVNALRAEHPDVDQATIGQAVTTIGQGIAAATFARDDPLAALLNLDTMPVVPSSLFHGGEPTRVLAMADVQVNTTDQLQPGQSPDEANWDVRTECGDEITFQQLIDCIEAHVTEFEEDSPGLDIQPIINRYIHLYFLGKRF